MAARRLETAKELLILPRNMTEKLTTLLEGKRRDSLFRFCDDDKSIDEVERIARYNGYPKAGMFSIWFFGLTKTVQII
jgi:hypothetical protein